MPHLTAMFRNDAAHLAACLERIRASPRELGTIALVTCRPAVGSREVLGRAALDRDVGVVGDTWHVRPSKKTPDGAPHPGMQVTLMNVHAVTAVTSADPSHWPLAGDNLFVDLDLTDAHLPVGTRLAIGDAGAVLAVTDAPHNGCAKFTERFGSEATRWLNTDEGRRLKLRGIHARVVAPGTVAPGDAIRVDRTRR